MLVETQNEIWKDAPGYEGYYQVSNLGNIKSLSRYVNHGSYKYFRNSRIRKPFIAGGYYQLTLDIDGQHSNEMIHRLVAKAFIDNPENHPYVNHKDGNKLNNCVDNLEWCTASDNAKHAVKLGLIRKDDLIKNSRLGADKVSVRVLCEDTGQVFPSIASACSYLGTDSIISNIYDHKRTHNGRGWLFRVITEEEYNCKKDDDIDEEVVSKIHATIRSKIKQQGRAIPIYCVERNKYYSSRSEAARDNNMNVETINLAIQGHRKAKGMTFKIVEEA